MFFLARTLGRPVAEILEMPSGEFTYWQAAYRVTPWGEHLQDIHFAQVTASIYNASGNMKSAKRTEEFLLLKPATSGLSEEARKYLKESERGKRR